MSQDEHDDPLRHEDVVELGELHMRSRRDGDVHTVKLDGELDLANAPEVERELKRVEATDAPSLVLDLSGLTFLDSTGIRLVLETHARSQHQTGRLVMVRAAENVQRVFRIAGVEERLPFAD